MPSGTQLFIHRDARVQPSLARVINRWRGTISGISITSIYPPGAPNDFTLNVTILQLCLQEANHERREKLPTIYRPSVFNGRANSKPS